MSEDSRDLIQPRIRQTIRWMPLVPSVPSHHRSLANRQPRHGKSGIVLPQADAPNLIAPPHDISMNQDNR